MFSFAGTFLLFLLLIWRLDLTEAKQSFDREPEHSEVNPGEDTVLTCRIFDKHRNSICNWLKNGLLIRIQNGKYEWEGNRDAGDCSLRVHEANINFDNGKPSFKNNIIQKHVRLQHTNPKIFTQFSHNYYILCYPVILVRYMFKGKDIQESVNR